MGKSKRMNEDSGSVSEEELCLFHPFTRQSLDALETHIEEEHAKKKELEKRRAKGEVQYDGKDKDKGPQPDPALEQGMLLPVRLQSKFPNELAGTKIKDIDSFYHNQRTFVIISKGKDIFRFSTSNALWILDPFNPIRHLAICTLVHPLFSFFILTTILVNFFLMTLPTTPTIEFMEVIFIAIYTFEVAVKVVARGFILQPFTYLRDPWNRLDFFVTINMYIFLWIDMGNFAALRAFRILLALKTAHKFPGLKTIATAVMESLKNLCDMAIFTMFFLSIFAVFGLQLYMGVLTHKCIRNFPNDDSPGNVTDESWTEFAQNWTNWYEEHYEYLLCGNSSGAGTCPPGFTCLQGYGNNPNYGYTSYDTFGWALLSSFRLMTEDYWENLYQLILRSAGPWHILFFMVILFFGSFFLSNLILAIVVTTYDKLQKKAEEEKAAKEEVKRESSLESGHEGTKSKNSKEKPFIDPAQHQTVVDINDVIVLKDITDQTAGKEGAVTESADENDEGPRLKKKLLAVCNKGIDVFCVWDCCWPWIKFQKFIASIVLNPVFKWFIILCIVVNTLFMALDHHDMDRDLERVLRTGHYFFVVTYAIEVALKLIAVSPKYYFQEGWNIFDFIIIAISLLEMCLEGVTGILLLRSFRLLRVLKQAKTWPSLPHLMSIVERTVGALHNLTFVLCIIVFIFAVIGMQFFGKNYIENIDRFPDEEMPRWNFTDFMHSFMIVFRVLCGEWIESMWDCMLVGDWSCILFFLVAVVFCNFVVLNLFLGLILSNFGSSYSTAPAKDNDANKMVEESSRKSEAMDMVGGDSHHQETSPPPVQSTTEVATEDVNHPRCVSPLLDHAEEVQTTGLTRLNELKDGKETSEIEGGNGLANKGDKGVLGEDWEYTPDECCPGFCYKWFPFLTGDDSAPFWQRWIKLRLKTMYLIENKYFEMAVTSMILLSSVSLALEDIHLPERPVLHTILYYMNYIFTIVFFLEISIRCLALGFKKYFSNALCLLDFIAVMLPLIDLVATWAGGASVPEFHCIRILRLLRAVSQWERMRVLVITVVQGIPTIFCALIICLFFWLIFAIVGVQLFAGKFYKCVDDNQTTISYHVVPDRETCMETNYTWENSPMNFDHAGNALLSLVQVATFKGWIQIMNDAVDSREVGKQPIREVNIYMYLYFVIFIIYGSFFTLNLIIGAIIENFNKQTQKVGSSLMMFMAEDAKKYYKMKNKGTKKLLKTIPRPKWKPQAFMYDICMNKKFEMIVMLFIGLHLVTVTFDHYQQSETFSIVLDYLNMIFIVIYSIECLMKIFALRCHYFKDPWNIFDFVVVISSILGLLLGDIMEMYFVSPVLLRLMRIAKVGRIQQILRNVKGARGTKTLLLVFFRSLPALFNIFLLLIVVMFIFAIFGMSLFMHVQDKGQLDDVYNFKTFGQSMVLLFYIATTAGWDGVLDAITNEEDCQPSDNDMYLSGNCGSRIRGITFLLSYLVISFLAVLNMFIAVILENFTQVAKDVQEGLTDDDYDMYYEI